MFSSSSFLTDITRRIDRFTTVTGEWVAWLHLPLVGILTYEVVGRYVFHAPTVWAFDLTYMLYASIFMLGCAFALLKGAHVRTDFFFEKWSPKTKGIIDSVAYLLLFFPSLTVFLWVSWDEAWYSFNIGEVSEQTPWRPILWPFKMIVPLTALLLLIQGVSETIKSVWAARTGILFEEKEKVEV